VREQGARTVAPGRGEKHWRSKTLEARLPVRKKPAITAAAAASQREFVGGEERIGGRAGGWGSRAALLDWGIAGVGRGGDLWSVVVNFRTRPAEVRVRWESGEWGWGSCDVRTVRGHDSPRASLVGFT
jgi:hypothetical protein